MAFYEPQGFGQVTNWPAGFTPEDIERRLTRFRETGEFRHLAAMKWPLLSGDLVEIQGLANINLAFVDRVWARPGIELPRLRQYAAG